MRTYNARMYDPKCMQTIMFNIHETLITRALFFKIPCFLHRCTCYRVCVLMSWHARWRLSLVQGLSLLRHVFQRPYISRPEVLLVWRALLER